jgi:hypothetical protein
MKKMEDLVKNLSHLMKHRKMLHAEAFQEIIEKILVDHSALGWELGQSLADPTMDVLYLSVKNAPQYLAEHQAGSFIFEDASDWKIEVGVAPKDWEMFAELNFGDFLFNLDGHEWSWANAVQSNFNELLLFSKQPFSSPASREVSGEISEFLLIGELGELNFVEKIRKLTILHERIHNVTWRHMSTLRSEFVNSYPECHYAEWLLSNAHAQR